LNTQYNEYFGIGTFLSVERSNDKIIPSNKIISNEKAIESMAFR